MSDFSKNFRREISDCVSRDDGSVCAFCCQNVVCETSSVKRYFETKHEKFFKDDADKIESLKKVISPYEKQSGIFKKGFAARIKQPKLDTKSQKALLNMKNHLLMGCL